jgi:hypothetical protein
VRFGNIRGDSGNQRKNVGALRATRAVLPFGPTYGVPIDLYSRAFPEAGAKLLADRPAGFQADVLVGQVVRVTHAGKCSARCLQNLQQLVRPERRIQTLGTMDRDGYVP